MTREETFSVLVWNDVSRDVPRLHCGSVTNGTRTSYEQRQQAGLSKSHLPCFHAETLDVFCSCFCAAMVHQHHEPHRNVADRPHGPAAAPLPTKDPHQDCEGTMFFIIINGLRAPVRPVGLFIKCSWQNSERCLSETCLTPLHRWFCIQTARGFEWIFSLSVAGRICFWCGLILCFHLKWVINLKMFSAEP